MTCRIARTIGLVLMAGVLIVSAPTRAAMPIQDLDPIPSPGTGAAGCPLMKIYPGCYDGWAMHCTLTGATLDLWGHAICNYDCRYVSCLST